MSTQIAFLALVCQVLLFIKVIRIWKYRALLSPALYFSIMWSLAYIGLLILKPAGLLFERYPHYIDELNILTGFTAICFYSIVGKGRKTIVEHGVEIRISSMKVYKVLAVLFFVGAVIDFIRLGGNLNMGAARYNLVSIQSSRPTWINYITTLSLPLSVFAGYKLFKCLVSKSYTYSNLLFLIVPLLGNLLFSINVGGRVDIIFCFAQYLIGFSLALPIHGSLKAYKKPLQAVAIISFLLVSFISVVANQRDKYSGSDSDVLGYLQSTNPIIKTLSGPIQYMLASYAGYQLRRVDNVDENHLGYGRYTFNGFINWTLPFASIYGLGDVSIAKSLGIYYYNQETYDGVRELYYTTHSCYIPIVKDFGCKGAFLCIMILVYLSHYFFIAIQRKQFIFNATSLFMYYLFWDYWIHSNFYGTLSSSILIPLYGFLIIDLANYVFHSKK